jgi:hypothetical protein
MPGVRTFPRQLLGKLERQSTRFWVNQILEKQTIILLFLNGPLMAGSCRDFHFQQEREPVCRFK